VAGIGHAGNFDLADTADGTFSQLRQGANLAPGARGTMLATLTGRKAGFLWGKLKLD
jgi:hypothetical protein